LQLQAATPSVAMSGYRASAVPTGLPAHCSTQTAQTRVRKKSKTDVHPGGNPNGANGTMTPGSSGAAHPLSIGAGGGIFTVATATIDFTTITGNTASSLDSDEDGTMSP
jgi:hypothetical protein